MRAVLLIVLAGFLVPAWATNTNKPMTLSQIAARQVEAKYGAADAIWRDVGTSRTVAGGTTLGEVVATSVVKGPSPAAGAVIDVAVKRSLPWAAISKGVARSLPLISTAIAIAEIAEAIRCREAAGGGSECDPGAPEQTIEGWTSTVTATGPTWTCTGTGTTKQMAATIAAECVVTKPQHSNCAGVISGTCYDVSIVDVKTVGVSSVTLNKRTVRKWCVSSVCSQWDGAGYPLISDLTVPVNGTSLTSCAPVVVNGVTLYPVKGPDGKCQTFVYSPATEQQVADKAEQWGDKTKAPAIVNDLLNAGKPIDHPAPVTDPVPDSVVGPRETTTKPDGSTTIRDTVWDLAPTPTGYEWTPRVVTKDYPPGAVIPPPGTVTDGTTTTGAPPKEDQITCGLPNTPPCKIDEGGTPPPNDPFEKNPSSWFDPIRGVFANPEVADTSWNFTFSLPTGCSVLTVGPFFSQTVTIDLCQYMPMIHDFMSIVWLMTGVWVCVGMVGRTLGGA